MPEIPGIDIGGAGALLVLAAVLVVVLLLAFAASRYRVANANEALIVAGRRGAEVRDATGKAIGAGDRGIRVVVGGGTVVMPLVHRVGKLELTARQIKVILPDAITCQGIKVHVEGVATFKIGRDVESIRNAAERFLGTNPAYIEDIVKNVLEGSLRSIVGTLTIEDLIMDREKLLQRVQDNAKLDLVTTGIEIDSFTIQSIEDESGYITQLGLQKLAPVTRDAKIAQAVADQESAVKQAEAEQIKINAARDVALRQADAEKLTAAAKATAEQAGPLAQAQAQQEVVRKQTELAMLQAERREKELLAATIKPAEADAQAAVRRAEGERTARIAIAEADARRTQITGEAEARVVLTKGQAFAEALGLKAEAYQRFNQAAILAAILEGMPDIVSAAAEPMANIDSLTVLSTDGAANVVRTTTETVAQANATIKSLTGLDVASLIASAVPARAQTPAPAPKSRRLTRHLGDEVTSTGLPADVTTVKALDVTSPTSRRKAAAPTAGGAGPRPARGAQGTQAPKPRPAEAGSAAPVATAPAPAPPAPARPPSSAAPAPPAAAAPAPAQPATPAAPAPAPPAAAAPAPAQPATPAQAASAAASPATKSTRAVDEALKGVAGQLRRVPGIGDPWVRALNLAMLGTKAPYPIQEIWGRYSSQIPESYRTLTIGELLDRYPE
jgi:flotillin